MIIFVFIRCLHEKKNIPLYFVLAGEEIFDLYFGIFILFNKDIKSERSNV